MSVEEQNSPEAVPELNLGEAFEGVLAWWRGTGVDCLFHDETTRWTAPPSDEAAATRRDAEQPARPSPVRPSLAAARPEPDLPPPLDQTGWPQTLDEFGDWWLNEPALDNGRRTGRVAPRGPRNAALLIVVPEPEREDRDKLLTGPHGMLLKAILSAMALDEREIYFASALTRHTPVTDWEAAAAGIVGAALRHHIALVAPRRILTLGSSILPLLGNDLPHLPANLRNFNHEGQSIPVLAADDLAALLNRPLGKKRFWQAWLEWTDTD